MLKLTVYDNNLVHSELELDQDEELIGGRSEKIDLVLSHEKVSREHFKVYYRAGQWIIEDFCSKNGTVVNGVKIKEQSITNGDVITIADFRIEVHLEELKSPPDQDVTVVAEEGEFGEGSTISDDRTIQDIKKVSAPLPLEEPPVMEEIREEEKPVAEEPEESKDSTEILEEFPGITVRNSLEFTSGKMEGNGCEFDSHILVGRSTKCDMVIQDETVSREHFEISCVKDKYVLTNLNKNNVTYLNGRMIKKANIKDGDNIRIGETTLKVNIFIKKKDEKKISWKWIIAAVTVIVMLAASFMVFWGGLEIFEIYTIEEQPKQAENNLSAAQYMKEGEDLFAKRDFISALQRFSLVIEIDPENKGALDHIAQCRSKIEEDRRIREEAEKKRNELEQKVIKLLAEVKELHARGMASYDKGDYYLALKAFQKIASMDIESSETLEVGKLIPAIKSLLDKNTSQYYERGIEYYEQEDNAEALASWQKVLDIDPDHAEAKKGISGLLLILEQKANVLYHEGLVFEGIGKIDKAVEKWKEVIKTVPIKTNEYYQKAIRKIQEHGEG